MATAQRVVIIGAGIAGVSVASGLRAGGYGGEIVLIGEEPVAPYRRPMLSKEVLRGDGTLDRIHIKPQRWYETKAIDIRTGVSVVELDIDAHTIALSDGTTLQYSQVVLATGAVPRKLAGPAQNRVMTLRDAQDVTAIQQALEAKEVIVVGAGLVGAELAASARDMGCQVTMLEADALPMSRVLPEVIGQRYIDLHREHGVDVHTGVTITEVTETADLATVIAADGRSWSAPLVVVAIGIEPNTMLAEKAGVEISDGITTDAYGRTSAPDVYAVGDVACWPHPLGGQLRGEHWQGAQNQGTAIGKYLAGNDAPFNEVPWAWSDQYGLTMQITGWPELADDYLIDGSLSDLEFTAQFTRNAQLIGAISIGRPADIRNVRAAIAECVLP